MKPRVQKIVAGAALLVLGVLLWYRQETLLEASPAATPASTSEEPDQGATTPVKRRKSTPPPETQEAPDATDAAGAMKAVEELYQALARSPKGRVIRCPAGDLPDGHYRALDAQKAVDVAQFVLVRDRQFHAWVDQDQGSAVIRQENRAWAALKWAKECEVRTLRVPISGRVEHANGSPAPGHEVPSCDHGEWFQTDGKGDFQTSMLQGTTCYLIAFVETPDSLGRGPHVTLTATGPDPIEDVVLVLPSPDEMLDEDRMAALASHLADMTHRMIQERHEAAGTAIEGSRLDPQTASQLSSDARAVLEGWGTLREEELRAMERELERLDDPEQQVTALRDAFLKQY